MLVEVKNLNNDDNDFVELKKYLENNGNWSKIKQEIEKICKNEEKWVVPSTILNGSWVGTVFQPIYDYFAGKENAEENAGKWAGLIFKKVIAEMPNVYFEQKKLRTGASGYIKISIESKGKNDEK